MHLVLLVFGHLNTYTSTKIFKGGQWAWLLSNQGDFLHLMMAVPPDPHLRSSVFLCHRRRNTNICEIHSFQPNFRKIKSQRTTAEPEALSCQASACSWAGHLLSATSSHAGFLRTARKSTAGYRGTEKRMLKPVTTRPHNRLKELHYKQELHWNKVL